MKEKLEQIRDQAKKEISQADSLLAVKELRVKFLGRKEGKLNEILRGLKDLPEVQKPMIGQIANQIKGEIEKALAERISSLGGKIRTETKLDLTQPGLQPPVGHLHLVTQAIKEIVEIFERIGFQRERYPEVEWDYYAFGSLNMPEEHPARDEWETFFIQAPANTKMGKIVLTPHTSNGQVREMEKGQLPIRMINVSKCYRRQIDVSHVPMFHQFEGLCVDQGISIAHLKGTIEYFAKQFFGPEREIRLRPFHFQFTEPSFEIDVSCGICQGTGKLADGQPCRLCKSGWHELAGAGMVHPNVLKAGGIDPKKYTGWAFGFGVERTYMMKGGINLPDIRMIYQNDLRFLEQF